MVTLLVGCATQQTPTSLAERHIDVRGGRAALENLQVVERVGTFTFHGISPPATGTYRTCVKYNDRVVIDIDAGVVQVHQVLGENGPLECDGSFTNCAPASPAVVDDLRATANVANREELDKPPPADAEPIMDGSRLVGYRYAKGDRVVEEEYDPGSGLLRRKKSGTNERFYSEYRDAGGVLIPMGIVDHRDGQKTVSIALSSATMSKKTSAWCTQRLSAKAN